MVDSTGAVKERYSYTPYGEVTILDASFTAVSNNVSTISNEHLYTGRRRDPETGLQLNRNRFYAAGLGRWVNRDPIGQMGRQDIVAARNVLRTFDPMADYYFGFSLYEYAYGDPIYHRDFNGLQGHSSQKPRPVGKPPKPNPDGPDDKGWAWPNRDELVSAYNPFDNDVYPPDKDLQKCHRTALAVAGTAGTLALACKCLGPGNGPPGDGDIAPGGTPKPPFGGSGPNDNVIIRWPPEANPIQRPGIGPVEPPDWFLPGVPRPPNPGWN